MQMHILGLGVVLQQERLKAELTQEKVAEVLGTDKGSVSRYESGKQQIPNDKLLRLCELYSTSPEALWAQAAREVQGASVLAFDLVQGLTEREAMLVSNFRLLPEKIQKEYFDKIHDSAGVARATRAEKKPGSP